MRAVLVVMSAVVAVCCCQNIPINPCPQVFRYMQTSGVVHGRLVFPNDLSGDYRLSVNMSIAAYLTNNENIRLELLTSTEQIMHGQPLTYNVYFPIQNIIPKPTSIEFNRRVYCSGPPEELRPGRGVTNMWASTFFKITGSIRPSRPNGIDNEIFQPSTTRPIFTLPTFFTLPTVPTNAFTLPTVPSNPFIPSLPASSPSTPTEAPFTSGTRQTTQKPPLQSNSNVGSDQCGVSFAQHLVVGGEEIEEGQFPWMVAVMRSTNGNYNYSCSGTLVSNKHVITAGHCVRFYNAPLAPIEDLLLVFGKVNIEDWASGGVTRRVSNSVAHPDYKQNHGDGDVAVLTMDRPIEFQPNIRPICLWQEDGDLDLVVGAEGTVAGWGMDESGSNFVPEAKKVTMPIVSQGTCLRSDKRFVGLTSNQTFCAGSLDGTGPCAGDSGAGFVLYRNRRWTLRGVVSSSLDNSLRCNLDSYLIFADVAKMISWLKTAMT